MQIAVDTSRKISLLSFIAAVLVCCIHLPKTDVLGFSWAVEHFFGWELAGIAVPLFFGISGYFLARHVGEEGWYGSALRKRVKSLLVPYLIWCVILALNQNLNSLIANVVHHQPLLRHINLNPVYVFGLDPMKSPPMPLWYVRQLIIFVLLSPLLARIAMGNRWLARGVIAMLVVVSCFHLSLIPEQYHEAFAHQYYPLNWAAFMLGMHLTEYSMRFSRSTGAVLLVLGLTMMIFRSVAPCCHWGLSHLSQTLQVLQIVVFIAGIWVMLPVGQLPEFLKNTSFPIYLMHPIFITLIAIGKNLVPAFALSAMGYFLGLIFILVCCIALHRFLARCCPRISNLIFGGR